MFQRILLLLIVPCLLHCNKEINATIAVYKPSVYFAGFVNADYDSLPGNIWYPNTCKMVNDTIRIYMYSEKFYEESLIRHGDLMRFDIYPEDKDSILGIHEVLFHLARYQEGNSSYYVTSQDSFDAYVSIQARILRLERNHGGIVELDAMFVRTGVVTTTHGEALSIMNGRIKGRIE